MEKNKKIDTPGIGGQVFEIELNRNWFCCPHSRIEGQKKRWFWNRLIRHYKYKCASCGEKVDMKMDTDNGILGDIWSFLMQKQMALSFTIGVWIFLSTFGFYMESDIIGNFFLIMTILGGLVMVEERITGLLYKIIKKPAETKYVASTDPYKEKTLGGYEDALKRFYSNVKITEENTKNLDKLYSPDLVKEFVEHDTETEILEFFLNRLIKIYNNLNHQSHIRIIIDSKSKQANAPNEASSITHILKLVNDNNNVFLIVDYTTPLNYPENKWKYELYKKSILRIIRNGIKQQN